MFSPVVKFNAFKSYYQSILFFFFCEDSVQNIYYIRLQCSFKVEESSTETRQHAPLSNTDSHVVAVRS